MARRAGLGRGLDSLLTDSSVARTEEEGATELKLADIVPNKSQPRKNFDKDALEELASSIKANGILQPILVRPKDGVYEIVAGERRYQAAKLAKLKTVPAVIREVSDDDLFQLALIENLQRADLNPLEEAEAYKKLLAEGGLTQDALSKAVSKSRSAIANSLRLLDLSKEVQVLIENGDISAGHARAVLMIADEGARERFAQKIAREHLSVRQAEALAALYIKDVKVTPSKQANPGSFKAAARSLRKALKTKVRVRQVRGKNKIELEFEDEDDLARIVDIITSTEKE